MGNAVVVFVGILVLFYVPIILYFKFGYFAGWFHNILGWHQPDNSPQWSDGCSVHAKCKWCGKEIMQDSHGDWF